VSDRDKIISSRREKRRRPEGKGRKRKKQEYCTIYYPVARGRNKRKGA
jgi:hypothetical protein